MGAYLKIASICRRANTDHETPLFVNKVSFAFKPPEVATHQEIEPTLMLTQAETATEILEFAGVDPTSGVSHNWSVASEQVLVTFTAGNVSLEKIVVRYNKPGPREIRGFQLLSMTWYFKHAQTESVTFA